MTDDHHGRVSGEATLLVKAVDAILGTHRVSCGLARKAVSAAFALVLASITSDGDACP
jgi:hypothetical protein